MYNACTSSLAQQMVMKLNSIHEMDVLHILFIFDCCICRRFYLVHIFEQY